MDSRNALAKWVPEGISFAMLCAYARNEFSHPSKVRIVRTIERNLGGKILRHPGGGRLKIDGSEYIGWSLLTRGVFEPLTVSLAISLMQERGVFVDVGANRGLFSIAVGAATDCKVVAVEPALENFRHLVANARLNPGIRLAPVNCCASSTNTLLQLEGEEGALSAWTSVRTGSGEFEQPHFAGLTLDHVLHVLDMDSVRVLKIDVEGYELEVLRGLDWSGPCRPGHVLMECNGGDIHKIAYLCDRGYVPRTVDGSPIAGKSTFPEGNLHFADAQ